MKLIVTLTVALLAGMVLGWVYFQALWATLQRLAERRFPAVWIGASFLLRLGLALVTLMGLVRWGGWPALVAALIGFVAARAILVKRLQPAITAERT